MNAPTDWASAVAILAAGIVLGLLFVFTFNKRRKTFGDDVALKDLQAKRDALLQQLRDPAVEGDERTRLEVETADVLRRLDAYGVRPTTQPAAPLAMNPAVKGFLWGAGSVAALAGLGYFVMQQAAPRQEGGSLTGGFESGAPQQAGAGTQPAQNDPAVQQLEAAVQRDPDNLQLRNDLAQAYLERENLMGVFQQTQFVLEKAPNDSRALTFQGLVRMAMGEADEAMKMLERATQSNAKNLDAWVAMAWVYVQSNRMADAERMIAEAAKQSPQDKARLDQVLAQMKQQAAMQPPAGQQLPADHPPIGGAPAATAGATPATAPSGPSVRVTLDLDANARQRTGILFVIARNPAGGPPAAVKRIASPTFPVTFDLSSADSMMGQPLPAKFRLEARLDSDGDATTKPPTDPSAMREDVVAGTSVSLALK
ncbi:MAG TPA: tetratricopeptide repeat protein [Thermoanaerobaculia bacterium]